MSQPIVSGRGLVPVSNHQFYLLDMLGDHSPTDGPEISTSFTNGLIEVQHEISIINTGIADGDARVSVEAHKTTPVTTLEGWEDVVETSFTIVHDRMIVESLEDDLEDDLPDLTYEGPGKYRVRVHVRGRDNAVDLVVFDPVEDYLLQVWPTSLDGEVIHKQSDHYGARTRRSARLS